MKARRDVRICFVLSAEERQRLEVLAAYQGRSAAGVIRNIILQAWARDQESKDDAIPTVGPYHLTKLR